MSEFIKHLEEQSKIVKRWPKWKRDLLRSDGMYDSVEQAKEAIKQLKKDENQEHRRRLFEEVAKYYSRYSVESGGALANYKNNIYADVEWIISHADAFANKGKE